MAKDNKIIIEIVTNDKGTTAAIRNNKKLDDSMKKTRKSTDEAASAGRGYHATHKSIYQTNLSSAKGFSKQAESIGSGGSSGLVGAYATLAANVFAATAAFNALRGAAQVQTLIEGFEFLGNAAGQTSMQIAKGIVDATDNAVSLEAALRSASIAMTSGFNTEQIAGLTEVARNASIALGRNLSDSLDRLFRGVAKLEPEILDELGIMVRLDTAVTKYATSLQKNAGDLTDYERRQAFLNETLTQGALKYGDLSDAVDPNAYDKLAAALQDLSNRGLELINRFLNPFIQMLASNSGALLGGLILFASTILTTMIPALGQMAERQAQVAKTARHMADEQAAADKRTAQSAKIKFVRTEGSAAFTTKGKDFSAVTALKKDLKAGRADALSFNKALTQINNTQKRTANIAKKNGTANSAAHQQRMAELEALKAQILGVQQAEAGRSGSAGASALASGQMRAEEGASQSMMLIGGSGAFEGFKLARQGVKDYKKEIKDASDAIQGPKSPFKIGFFTKWGRSLSAAFGVASISVRLFGAALLNAIPIIGQVLFFGGLLISFLMSFKGGATDAEKAQANLTETVDKAKEKIDQLVKTNKELVKTLDDLDKKYRDVAISATAQMNTIVVTAGVVNEARVNFKALTKELENEEISAFSNAMSRLGKSIKEIGSNIKDFLIQGLKNTFPLLTKFIEFLERTGVIDFVKEKLTDAKDAVVGYGKAVKESFEETDAERRIRQFTEAIESSSAAVAQLKSENVLFADVLEGFDPGKMYQKLLDEGATFADANDIVNAAFEETTRNVEESSENLKGLATNLGEVGKVINKNIDGMLKINDFDKVSNVLKTLDTSLVQLSKGGGLTSAELFNQIQLASVKSGVDLTTFGVTVDSVKAAVENSEGPFTNLQQQYEKLAEKVRTNSHDKKELANDMKILNTEFAKTKALDEYTAKLSNFTKTGKFQIGVVDNYNLQIQAAENAAKLAEDEFKLKEKQIKAQYALELFKLDVLEAQAIAMGKGKEFEDARAQIVGLQAQEEQVALDNKIKKEKEALAIRQQALSDAGSTGTIAERSQVVASALNDQENTTAGRLQNVANAMQPMQEALKDLGPEGEAVSAAFDGIMSIAQAFQVAGAEGATTADKLQAVGAVVSAISAAMAANSRAQIKEIDNQIDKEKKRDGKSKESLAKIAAMEKKKDQMARKAFEQGKKMKIAQAIISTSAAIAGQLSADPVGPWNVALAAMMGALGMAQVKIIQKQQYQGSDSSGGSATPQTIQVGKRTNRVDTSRAVTDGELAFLRGAKGQGSNANNFTPGGAAGMKRGYANGGEIMVGERGPETITPMAGGYEVTPNDKMGGQNLNANITINAIDAAGVEEVLTAQRGNIIGMIREAAHEHGEEFIESVNTSSYGAAEGDGGY